MQQQQKKYSDWSRDGDASRMINQVPAPDLAGSTGSMYILEAVAPRACLCGKRVRTRSDKLQQADTVGPRDGKLGGLLQTSKWPAHQPKCHARSTKSGLD